MRNAIYAGIVGFVVGITVGVYGIAPDSEVIVEGVKKEKPLRESDVKDVAASADGKQKIIIGSGNVKSPYHSAGTGICRFVNKGTEKHGITCLTENTSGSAFNIKNIRRSDGPGKLTVGIAQSRWLNLAYADGANDTLRAIFTMHPEPLTVVARAGSGIKNIMDLKGKRVNIGNPGSPQRDAMNVLMTELGWDTSAFSEISELDPHGNATGGVADSRLNASAELCENRVDAIVFAEANPNPYIREASFFCEVVLVDVSGPAVDKLVADSHYYVATTIPGETYLGTPNDTKTFGAVATLMSSLFIEPNVIYEVIKAVFENFDEFKALDPAFETLTKEVMVNEGIQVPLHGGADKYLLEVKMR